MGEIRSGRVPPVLLPQLALFSAQRLRRLRQSGARGWNQRGHGGDEEHDPRTPATVTGSDGEMPNNMPDSRRVNAAARTRPDRQATPTTRRPCVRKCPGQRTARLRAPGAIRLHASSGRRRSSR